MVTQIYSCPQCGNTHIQAPCKGVCKRCYMKSYMIAYRQTEKGRSQMLEYSRSEARKKSAREWEQRNKGRRKPNANYNRYRQNKYRNGQKELDQRITNRFLTELLNSKRCQLCKKEKKLEFDHIVPVSWGGSHKKENFRVICHHCNTKRQRKLDKSGLKINEDELRERILAFEQTQKF